MTKLDEIEAINNILVTGASRTDVKLLIRAVRQLGSRMEAAEEYFMGTIQELERLEAEHPIDPDVLELIEEAE